jgi:endoglucanase
MTSGFLSISGPSVLDGSGEPIALRGVNLGGWMNYEGFILGHPGTETLFRRSLRAGIGEVLYARFSERLLESFSRRWASTS